jgi:hypothetical protein
VEDLLFGGVVTETVELLKDEDFKHREWFEGRFATFFPIPIGVARNCFEKGAETFSVSALGESEGSGMVCE